MKKKQVKEDGIRIDSISKQQEYEKHKQDSIDTAISKDAFSNTFVTQLEALGEIKRSHIIWSDTIGKSPEEKKILIRTAMIEEKRSHTFWWLSFALTILFLVIELLPILTKLIIARGSYDEYIDMEEYKVKEHIETEKSISLEIERKRLEQEVASNQQLMSKIAGVQAELLETAIEEWRKAELEKIHADPSKYIKSNTTKDN